MNTPEATPAPTQGSSSGAYDDSPLPTPPHNVGSVPFVYLTRLFENLQNERKMDRRMRLLSNWFNHWRQQVGNDLYPVLRLILPQKDRDRAVYGLKEKNLAKIYIKLIVLGKKDPDSIRLLNWKKPTEKDKSSGDFPTVLYEVVAKRSSVVQGTLTIQDINDVLDQLSECMNKQETQMRILEKIYNECTAEEQRWITRIILKDMVISVKETTVFSVFHADAQDLYNTCSDLKRIAWTLWDPAFRLRPDDKNVRLFHAFAPMLCKRPNKTIELTVKEMGGTEFIIEEKLDGERMQLHKRGNEFFYCSRKGKDYTYLYGKHVGTGTLTPYIADAFDERISNIILDGEMLVYDPISDRNLPFGTLKTAALDKTKKEHNPRPCFKVFDLLYLNGQSLLNKSTAFRKKNLRACLTEAKGRLELTTEMSGKTAKDIREAMDKVMEDRGEGLVIKHPKSKYILNGRNMDWIKVKPEYMDNMGETVDVLVVAGNYGSGYRSGGVSTIICAVLDDRNNADDDGDEPKYSTFVRIGTGLSFADYVWIRSKPWKPWDPKNPPSFLQTANKSTEDKGDLYLEPEHSFILKVKAAEITASDKYHLGFTMRFPRALAIRDDLSISDCMTATEVQESIRSEKKRKMDTSVIATTKKKRKITAQKAEVIPNYKGPELKEVPVESQLFRGTRFLVIGDPKSRTGNDEKQDMMKLIHAHGGQCVQIARGESLFVVYGGKSTPYDLKLIINKDIFDVVKPQWIKDCVEQQEQVPLTQRYLFYASSARKETQDYMAEAEDVDMDNVKTEDQSANVKQTVGETSGSDTEDDDESLMAAWVKIEREPPRALDSDDSETEPDDDFDSDNEDAINPDQGVAEDDVIPPEESKNVQMEDVKMGETDDDSTYDPDNIFTHLCFYLDSPANATVNGMPVKTKHEKEINESLAEIGQTIAKNGGKVVSLDDPKLTHVVVDKRDASRRLELIRRTSQPKRRHLVIAEFVAACVDEETLLDEDEFMP